MVALQALRTVNSNLADTQSRVSSGLRIQTASDNAAYWSISTTMRSDRMAVAAVSDALGLGSAKVDIAYQAMEQTGAVLSEIKSKLVAASENGVDKGKIQDEISQLVQQTVTIAGSASFNGVNWLDTDIHDLFEADPADRSAHVVSSFVRNADGTVGVGTMSIDQIMTSLYNKEGGGILDGDPRSPLTIGGMREANYFTADITNDYFADNVHPGAPAVRNFNFTGPTTFSNTDQITFDVTVDGDNPSQGLAPPLNAGHTTVGVTINRALINSTLGRSDGVISDNVQLVRVLNAALTGTGASASYYRDQNGNVIPDRYTIETDEDASFGLNGSQIEISNYSASTAVGDLGNGNSYGYLGSAMTLSFTPFKIYRDVSLDFTFGVNGEATETHTIDRNTINTILGTTDGWVNTADDMVTVLKSLITRPNTIIEANGSQVLVRSDPLDDRLNGGKTQIGFSNMTVNVEPLPMSGLKDVDVERNPGLVNAYLYTVETMLRRVVDGAAALGSLKNHIDMQTEFAGKAAANIDKGIGRLVDADMEEESTRLTALQTQQQLALQSMSIANSAPNNIIQLFR